MFARVGFIDPPFLHHAVNLAACLSRTEPARRFRPVLIWSQSSLLPSASRRNSVARLLPFYFERSIGIRRESLIRQDCRPAEMCGKRANSAPARPALPKSLAPEAYVCLNPPALVLRRPNLRRMRCDWFIGVTRAIPGRDKHYSSLNLERGVVCRTGLPDRERPGGVAAPPKFDFDERRTERDRQRSIGETHPGTELDGH